MVCTNLFYYVNLICISNLNKSVCLYTFSNHANLATTLSQFPTEHNVTEAIGQAGGTININAKADGVIIAAACNRYSAYSAGWSGGMLLNYYSNGKGEGYWAFGHRETPTATSYAVAFPYSAGSYKNMVAISLTGKT